MKDDVNEIQECQCQSKAKAKDKYDEIFSKWQFKQIDYLTFNINLILTISLAIVGFIISNLNIVDFKKIVFYENSLRKVSLTLLLIIITIGIVLNYIRYLDFKYTKDIVKLKKKGIFESPKIIHLRCLTNCLGNCTKILFTILIFLFLFTIWYIIMKIE